MTVGKSVSVLDAHERITGSLPYAIDLQLPGMLHMKVLRSMVPHARITRIDASRAELLPGVAAVLTAADLDHSGGPKLLYGMLKDQPIVARDRIRFVGEPLALIAAETPEIAEAATDLIEIDWEELPAVYNEVEASQEGAPTLHDAYPDNRFRHAKLRHGDLDAGFAAADEIIEETYTSPVAQQASLEPHATAAQWINSQLTVWSGTQAPYRVKETLEKIFELSSENVRLIVPQLGGGFGGKGHVRIEPMVAALAWKVGGRPVKLVLTRAEEFVTVTKHAATIIIKTGVKRDGTITARKVTIYWNGGAYSDASPALVRSGMVRSVGPYRCPTAHIDSYGYFTNLPPAAAFRGAMSSQTTWAYESHMDTIAHRLGIDPLELRLKNLIRSDDHFVTGETMHDVHFVECLEAVANGLGWKDSKPAASSEHMKRGRGLAVMIKSTRSTSRSEVRMLLDAQGHLTLYHSVIEMGQGAHTVLAQISSEAMGIPLDSVSVPQTDTAVTPYDSGTSSSRGTNMMGEAILHGAAQLKEELVQLAAPLLEQPPEDLVADAGIVFDSAEPDRRLSYGEVISRSELESLEVVGVHDIKSGIDPETGQGIASPHWHQGAGACEIEIDTQTGKLTVLRYFASSFAGRVINPALAKLQNDGNVIYGMGPTMSEEMVFDGGQVTNANLSDYMVPSILDIPEEITSYAIESEVGEFHGIGEMTLPPVSPAIANAIFDATGVRIRDLPLTAERLLRALQNEA